MNFIFDNCISPRIAHAIKSLAEADGDDVFHIKDKFRQNVPDVEWVEALGTEGNWIVVSGDTGILKNPHERAVWQKAKLVGFFLAPAWLKLRMWDQAWHLVRKWPSVRDQAKLAAAGSTFEVRIKSSKFRPVPVRL